MKKSLFLIFIIAGSLSFAQSIRTLREEGVKAINRNDFEGAKVYYTKLLYKGHKTWETYVLLGDCEFKLGNLDGALTNFNEAQKKANVQDYATIYMRIGTIYMQQKEYEKAWMQFLKVEITRPNDYLSKKMQSNALYYMGKYNDALLTVKEAEKLNDSDVEINYIKGLILIKQNKIDEACSNFNKANSLNIPDLKIISAQYCNKSN